MIDPMTYSFGELYNYKTDLKENDLNWIMTKSKKRLTIKKSYSKLAISLGDKFQECVKTKIAISLEDLKNEQIRKSICESKEGIPMCCILI